MRVTATKRGIQKGLGSITFKISAESPASTLEGLQFERPPKLLSNNLDFR
jgi:hypothetical protein